MPSTQRSHLNRYRFEQKIVNSLQLDKLVISNCIYAFVDYMCLVNTLYMKYYYQQLSFIIYITRKV